MISGSRWPEYKLLQDVTHWTPEEVQREQKIKAREHVHPTHVLAKSFSEILGQFNFKDLHVAQPKKLSDGARSPRCSAARRRRGHWRRASSQKTAQDRQPKQAASRARIRLADLTQGQPQPVQQQQQVQPDKKEVERYWGKHQSRIKEG